MVSTKKVMPAIVQFLQTQILHTLTMLSRKKVILAIVVPAVCVSLVAAVIYRGRSDGRAGQDSPTQAPASGSAGVNAAATHAGHEAEGNALDWCSEHRVPESQCTLCNPKLVEGFKARGDWCGGHSLPESQCRLCNPGLTFPQEIALEKEKTALGKVSVFFPKNKPECATDGAVIRLASVQTADRSGFTFEPAIETSTPASIEAPAEVVYDASKTVALTRPIPVSVTRWKVEPGAFVKPGQVIGEAISPGIAGLKAGYVECRIELTSAGKELSRKESLVPEGIVSKSDWVKVEAAVEAARTRLASARGLLISAGLSDEDVELAGNPDFVSSRMLLRAPCGGVLLERTAPLGQLIEPGTSLALISDQGSLWVEAQVGERDIARVRPGQKAEFASDGSLLGKTAGQVIWVSQFLNQTTRTATVRASVSTAGGRMRAGEYGRLSVNVEDKGLAVFVPKDAVQWEGCCNVVFVRETADVFRPRKVTIERGDSGHYRVTEGVQPGDMVVVNGSYLLKTELRKSSIGAGCCGLEAE
ncbi:MAG: efflux RND transporter periplasmic adaptor subunit [Candidatus Eisenbacteria bacterium]|nr:efflux RND transporter periplasmic adaptor subunit [Candidatus Eisenbacteria bacterium]